jgi:tetratricopeptide (TPR) repeat protein
LNAIKDEWSPCKINGEPVDKKYFIIFRFRSYLYSQPPNYKEKAEKLFKKEKYEKALLNYDKAINENKYDYKLFESRSELKKLMGDTEGARIDSLESIRLQNEVISVVDIAMISITTEKKRLSY